MYEFFDIEKLIMVSAGSDCILLAVIVYRFIHNNLMAKFSVDISYITRKLLLELNVPISNWRTAQRKYI